MGSRRTSCDADEAAYDPAMAETTVDRAAARRFLVRRHLLAPPRSLPADPASVKVVVERLGSLQFDPLDVTGRNHDLVLAARIEGYAPRLDRRPPLSRPLAVRGLQQGPLAAAHRELPYYRIGWDRYQASNGYGKMDDHAELVEELLDRIRQEGTLSSTDVEPRASIDWYWRPTNQVRAILEALSLSGVLAISRRDGNRRLYDLSERLFPAELLAERRTEDEQRRHKLLSRYRAHGLLGMRGGNQEVWIGTAPTAAERYRVPRRADRRGPPAAGVGRRRQGRSADPGRGGADAGGGGRSSPRPASHSSRRSTRSSGTASSCAACGTSTTSGRSTSRRAKRRWGYYVLPLLWGERFVGRIEPRIERKTGTLRVLGLWWEDGFDPLAEPGFVDELAAALRAHAAFLGATKIVLPRTARHRALVGELRSRIA